jgi:hypothetical protein
MDLRKQAETISCNHNNYLDEKYNLYNDYQFRKNLICKTKEAAPHIINNKENLAYLKSLVINKKSCVFFPAPYDLSLLEGNPYNYDINEIPIEFNVNTRIKTIVHNN